ncbi:zinc ABC transporter ATP-binding protein AztA [Polaromonas sp.]|uniref:zinc ABC transporter ATP-binding protein AztA n=1 Tax=Polaromonas sp. TaxID=1869339 RepID=UPI003529FB51
MVTLDNLTVSYRRHPALHHISGSFAPGSLTAVVGPNGSGKSTLLKTIIGLLPVAGGTITVSEPQSRIAYLPQLADVDRSFPINVYDCVLLGCWPHRGAWGRVNASQRSAIEGALASVGLQGFDQRPISSLSSGQLQRVLFARLLMQDADLILLDEPFNAMDGKTTAAVLTTIARWHQQGRTVVVVLHDEGQVRGHFPQALLLARELVAWGQTDHVMTVTNLSRARTMAEAWDDDSGLCEIDSLADRRTAPQTPQMANT